MTTLIRQVAHTESQHPASAPALAFRNVYAAYAPAGNGADAYALEDVTFTVAAGEQVAIIGPNGAGKSTLLRLVAGALQPARGEVRLAGNDPAEHVCIAYVPQRSQLNASFPATVEDVVMMGRARQIGLFRRPRRGDRDFVRRSLARVDALPLAKMRMGELSGGQQQRVLIARALAQEAALLLLDEPLTGLDAPSREKILEILGSLRPDGVTVLFATHDLDLAVSRFDRVMLLNRRLIAFGRGAEAVGNETLRQAYGPHIHRLGEGGVLLDDCCDEGGAH
jgi:manganese/iron transport system ATP-binding protein